MRTSTTIEALVGSWQDNLTLAVEAEKLGMDMCWISEAWGSDAPSPLGYLAGRTDRMLLGSGTLQLGTRTPTAIATTAMTLSELSGGRFVLGLGNSGPQVIEGMHGVAFDRPLRRMRETVDVVRQVFAGDKIEYHGSAVSIPLPGGDGVPMRSSLPANPGIPIYVAALMPKMLELVGEIADGWLGSSFVPEGADAYLEPLRAGADRAGRRLADLDLCQGAEVNFVDDERELAAVAATRKKDLAFSLGGMGSATTNFYNSAYSRQGWADVAAEVRALWQAGRHTEATALVSDDMIFATTLIGTEDMIRDRLALWRDRGVTTVRFYPAGETVDAKLTNLARAIELAHEIG
ncbi:LLM class flavin-dependent oxidoreductase [Pseudonocardia benzenivorans]|jgi:F420-dependent oxidoreductase-like protein|uniref:Luciferase-like, subgroup n=2 Tax=Pseudonocardia TaxID=1847 RepID=F4CUS4_PSEUX|nr:LLM class flavin-dependent oxidoreductase [Pseudonocardia dioxanivorans]AEA26388.1 Luciferase-like, subgroup [Pseudonocardia dioxanivorans CB1190]GJF03130.1 FMN-dependent monooxygenase [Pseudonocardia sp. D17]